MKVGDENKDSSEIKFNAATLGVESEALEVIDARNASTIEGSVSLTKCPRIREAYFGGTNLKSVIAPTGGRLTTLQMPESLQDLILHSLNLLNNDGLDIPEEALSNIRNLYINSCDKINPIQLLKRIYDTPDNKLSAIGLIWKGVLVDEDGSAMRMFGKIAEKAGQDGGYSGVDFTNDITPTTMPNVSGALDATGLKGVYQEDIDNILAKLPNLLFSYNPDNLYISFEDEEVLRVLLAKGVGDGVGITTEAASKVTSIGNWFKGNTAIEYFNELEKFTSITQIGTGNYDTGFKGCSSLKSLRIPSSVTRIVSEAFDNTPLLESIGDTTNVKTIGSTGYGGGFRNSGVKCCDFPNLEEIRSIDCWKNSGLEEIVSLGKITTIPGNHQGGTFSNCTKLTKAVIPTSVKIIRELAFGDCTALSFEELQLQNLEVIERNAFRGVKIKKISSLGNITNLPSQGYTGGQTFGDTEILEEIVLPETLGTVGDYAMMNYSNCNLNIPSSVKTIGLRAFAGCSSATIDDLSLPTLESLGQIAFQGMKIRKISNLGKITEIAGQTWNLYDGYGDRVTLEEIIFPDTLTKIGDYAFHDYTKCVMRLPSSITNIGFHAFLNTLLEGDIYLPKLSGGLGQNTFRGTKITKVSNLGSITTTAGGYNSGVFMDCTELEECILPNTLTNIADGMFNGCSKLVSITIPLNVVSIGRHSFDSCNGLSYIISRAVTPPSLDSTTFHGVSVNFPIYVPDESVSAYREASVWVNYASRIKPLSEYVE